MRVEVCCMCLHTHVLCVTVYTHSCVPSSHGEDLTDSAGVGSTARWAGEMLVCTAHRVCFAERKARVIKAVKPQHTVSG